MARVAKDIEVSVPRQTAYNQWTQFEQFPLFMEGVKEVRQLDDAHLHWKAEVAGKDEEWDAEIREQVPDERIIWRSTDGKFNAGMVSFEESDGHTRVHLEMSYEPEGAIETIGEWLGVLDRRVEGDLQRFKEFIESRGHETGAWRGEIENPEAPGGHTAGRGSLSEREMRRETAAEQERLAGRETAGKPGDLGGNVAPGTNEGIGERSSDLENPRARDLDEERMRESEREGLQASEDFGERERYRERSDEL